MTSSREPHFRVRSLTTALYLPNFLFSVGRGVSVPVIALLALELGASPAVAGLVVALRGIGTMAFDIPAGVLISRVGEKRAMILAGWVLAVIGVGIALRPPLWLFAVLIMLMGFTWSVWHTARVAFAAGSTSVAHRGRVMSMVGGSMRIGLLAGPLLGSLVISQRGLAESFLVLALLSAAAAVSMGMARSTPFTPESAATSGQPTLIGVLKEHRATLATAGSVALLAQVLRSSREVLIPLWGDSLGIDASTIPLIFAASYALESLMFYPVGLLMDRKGRKWALIPCIALLSVGLALIPLSEGIASLTAIAILIGLGDGLGTGMNMTLSSDLAPLEGRSRFLGVWRLITDAGNAGGPLVVSAVTSLATLATAAVAVGAVGIPALILLRLVPETLQTSRAGSRSGR